MTATERFYIALSGLQPDRVPSFPKIWLDLGAELTGTGLREAIEDPFLAMELIVKAAQIVKADGARLFHFPARRNAMKEDVLVETDHKGGISGKIDVQGGLATQLSDAKMIRLEDPMQMAFLQFYHARDPLVKSVNDVKRITVPDKAFFQQFGFSDIQKRLLDKYSERVALVGDCASGTLAFCVLYRKYENALMDLIEKPGLAHALMEKGVAFSIEKGKFHIDTGIKMLRLNDSPANMSVISPDQFREFVFPHLKTVCDELHHYDPEVKIYCHICGNILPILEDLVRSGLDCIGPLDPLGGVKCGEARRTVGDDVALMGGVNTLSFINSTPGQLIEESRVCMEDAGRKGYILGSGCAIPRHARKQNLLALRTAAEQFGTASLD
jgi:uroporphyrinogen-III decarboxylase